MSVFTVHLTNQFGGSPLVGDFSQTGGQGGARTTGEGNLDQVAQTSGTSIQRTAYVMGPNKINRKLVDGQTFTDCNYWLQFAPVSQGGSITAANVDQAFINVVSNDGSTYIAGVTTNSPVAFGAGAAGLLTTTATGGYAAANAINFLFTYGAPASFVQVFNTGTSYPMLVRINGTAEMQIAANTNETIALGDFPITKLEFSTFATGPTGTTATGIGPTTYQVIAGVQSLCKS